MSDPIIPEPEAVPEVTESFGDILAEFQQSHARKPGGGAEGREGTVIAVSGESVLMDMGLKVEGILPLAALQRADQAVKPGDKVLVTITGRDPESGYYRLSRGKVTRPTDWESLEKAFSDKTTIVGTVTGVVKGGLSVDVGVRAFLPGSRSGVRDAA